jgi:hypothetical protein
MASLKPFCFKFTHPNRQTNVEKTWSEKCLKVPMILIFLPHLAYTIVSERNDSP